MKRSVEIKVRLSRDEAERLNNKVALCGFSREAYIRALLDNHNPIPLPSDDLIEIIKQLRKIGTNLNQIAYKANAIENIDKESNFVFGLIRAVGMIILGWGIVQIGLSFQAHDPS